MDKTEVKQALRDVIRRATDALVELDTEPREALRSVAYVAFFAGRVVDEVVGDDKFRGNTQHEEARTVLSHIEVA